MSIFTQSPARPRRMSGLAAYAQILPQVRARGYEALLDLDWICDYDEIHRRVYADFRQREEYRGHPYDLVRDSAQVAHWIWLERCPQASVVIEERGWWGGDWWGWPGGGHGHHHHHHHHHNAPPPPGAPPGPPMPPMAPAMRHAPIPARVAPMAPRAMHHAPIHAHAARGGGGQHHGGRGHRGLGEVPPSADSGWRLDQSLISSMRSGTAATSAARATQGTLQRIQQHVSQSDTFHIAPPAGTGTLGCTDENGNPIPPEQMTDAQRAACAAAGMPGLSIAGTLPSGIAGALGLALGLVAVVALASK